MEVVRTLTHSPALMRRSHLAIGNFDGVHRGHQAILDTAVQLARAAGGQSGLVTFDPHPVEVLAPSKAPARLTTLERRLQLVEERGIDLVLLVPFDEQTASMEAEAFVQDVLLKTLNMHHVLVGPDCHFGRNRTGDKALLERMGEQAEFEVDGVPPTIHEGARISSSRIRKAIASGEIADANAMLGRPHRVSGNVVRGEGRGRTLGFPTANVHTPPSLLLPRTGVYHGAVHVDGDVHSAVINVGVKPTFGPDSPLGVEAHMLDHQQDLYGHEVAVSFRGRIRDEQQFSGVEALIAQVQQDIEVARRRAAETP